MNKILAIDPGMSGGSAYFDGTSIVLKKFTTEDEFLCFIGSMGDSVVSVIEDVPRFVSSVTSTASAFKLGYNYGFHVGALRSTGYPVNLVKPQVWQKGLSGLKPKMGYSLRKRVLKDNATRLFPSLKVTHAVADALLILYWYSEKRGFLLPNS